MHAYLRSIFFVFTAIIFFSTEPRYFRFLIYEFRDKQ